MLCYTIIVMVKHPQKVLQNTSRNDSAANLLVVNSKIYSIASWMAVYFQFEATTLESSQKVQRLDLATFLQFILDEVGDDKLVNWTPRLSQVFKTFLQRTWLSALYIARKPSAGNKSNIHLR